jgi:hypothetical protein
LGHEQVTEILDKASGSDEEYLKNRQALIAFADAHFETGAGKETLTAQAYKKLVDGELSSPPLWEQWCSITWIDVKLLTKSFTEVFCSHQQIAINDF